ncbi:MAG TPA: S9 family peptidase [Blastocatellia bacterium]|nr:S9 family peptidase [Blastocatellia bacterium]
MFNSYKSYALATCLLFCLVFSHASAQQPTKHLEPMDLFNLQTVSDAQISPDGTKIVYVRRSGDVTTDKYYSNLWIVSFDGSDNRPLTTGNRNDASPRWSPDGSRIIYTSDQEGKSQLYLRWMDTGQTAKITNLQYGPSAPAWSPDGKTIAFVSLVATAPPKIGTVPMAPPGAKWEPPARVYDKLVYRFNGSGYLPYASNQLFVIPAEGGTPRQLTSGDHALGGSGGFAAPQPDWTPDGKFILISANRRPDYEYEPQDTEVYEVSVADGSVKALTDRRGPDNSPVISPDGKRIAYLGFDDKYQGYQITRLYMMNRDGNGSRVVSADLDRDAGSPRWAPDGSGIYFTYADQGDNKIGFYSPDGKLKKIAEHVGQGGLTVASNGNFAFVMTTTSLPGDIAAGAPSNPSVKVLTSVNEGLLGQRKLGQVEEIWYESSVDHRKVEGWIIKPPDFDPSKKYPLILEIHGGPFAYYGDRFDVEKQMMAAQGYVVLYTNPRGSTSYGVEFGNLIHHAYPGDDFYDLNSGVDAVIAKGYVDRDNLFVTGGSGGGVLTCWMVDRTTRFRAAVSLYPVINWTSWTLTSDIPIVGAKYWFPGNPEDYEDQYTKRSVLTYANKVKTPTMLMVGEEDWRCPATEAEQFYAALKLYKVETVLVLVPGEPHGIARTPSHHVQKITYITNWFDVHRKK